MRTGFRFGTMWASSPTISGREFLRSDLIRLFEPPVYYGMIATGNHSDSDSLRGAPPSQGKAWELHSVSPEFDDLIP